MCRCAKLDNLYASAQPQKALISRAESAICSCAGSARRSHAHLRDDQGHGLITVTWQRRNHHVHGAVAIETIISVPAMFEMRVASSP
jgi:hypothetical protein